MDARSHATCARLCCLLITLGGCNWANKGGPSPRPQGTDNAEPNTHSEVVIGDVDGPPDLRTAADAAPNLKSVERWIEQVSRVDDLQSRISQHTLSEPAPPDPHVGRESPPDDAQAAAPRPSEPTSPAEEESQPATLRPPVLRDVSIRAVAPSPATQPALESDGPQIPGVNAPAQATASTSSLRQLADEWLAASHDSSFRSQLDGRLLQLLAGQYEEARKPLELVSNEQQQMAARLVEALIAIREGHGGDPAAEANRVLEQIKRLEESLVPLGDLNISALAITRAVRGYGRYQAICPPDFPAGYESEFVVYCELENFVSRLREDNVYESQFSMRTAILNRAGDVVLDINDEHIPDECRTRRRDCFIPRLVRLPATLSPGQYVVKVTIVDKIAGKVAEKRTTFRLVARS